MPIFIKSCQINSLDDLRSCLGFLTAFFPPQGAFGVPEHHWLIVAYQRLITSLLVQFSYLWICQTPIGGVKGISLPSGAHLPLIGEHLCSSSSSPLSKQQRKECQLVKGGTSVHLSTAPHKGSIRGSVSVGCRVHASSV